MTHGPQYAQRAGKHDKRFLNDRMAATSERLRGQSEISDRLKLTAALFLTWVALWTALTQLSPWNLQVTFRHLAAAVGCKTAARMDLAPARRGQAGYWSHLDKDRDGIACPAQAQTVELARDHSAKSATIHRKARPHG